MTIITLYYLRIDFFAQFLLPFEIEAAAEKLLFNYRFDLGKQHCGNCTSKRPHGLCLAPNRKSVSDITMNYSVCLFPFAFWLDFFLCFIVIVALMFITANTSAIWTNTSTCCLQYELVLLLPVFYGVIRCLENIKVEKFNKTHTTRIDCCNSYRMSQHFVGALRWFFRYFIFDFFFFFFFCFVVPPILQRSQAFVSGVVQSSLQLILKKKNGRVLPLHFGLFFPQISSYLVTCAAHKFI